MSFGMSIEDEAIYWIARNKRQYGCAGCCRHGHCRCSDVRHRDKNDLIAERLTPKGYIALIVCNPLGKDDHMAAVDPLLVRAKTIAFIMDMRDASRGEKWSWKTGEEQKWWEEHYSERNKVAIIKPSSGHRYVKRIAR